MSSVRLGMLGTMSVKPVCPRLARKKFKNIPIGFPIEEMHRRKIARNASTVRGIALKVTEDALEVSWVALIFFWGPPCAPGSAGSAPKQAGSFPH